MAIAKYDIIAIGNAIVDVLAHAEEEVLERLNIAKGVMTLVDSHRAAALYREMKTAIESSGGSAANTAAAFASFGGKAAFMGKVRKDQLGMIFTHDMQAIGVHYATPLAKTGKETALCLVFITPDGERTLNTHLGISVDFSPEDVDADLIADSSITYLEGYLWDAPHAKKAFLKASELAHAAGRKVSLTLSDPFCVERHRDSFLELIKNHIDILFANESEILSLFQCVEFEQALRTLQDYNVEIAALTRSEKGSLILADGEKHLIAARPIDRLIDSTGAGDSYAAGFLYGLTHNFSLPRCGALGSLAAAEIISQVGPRPFHNLGSLMARDPEFRT